MSRVLVLGGARSGKSYFAEQLLHDAPDVTYVACGLTASPEDLEWTQRIRIHQARRPAHWTTVETRDLSPELAARAEQPVLIDCLSTWLSGTMDDVGLWDDTSDANAALAQRIDDLVTAWGETTRNVVAVSNEVGSGVVPATTSGRRYRDELGALNARIAAKADEVWLLTAGIGQRLK